MTIDIPGTIATTLTLTPLQEKAIFGVDILKNINDEALISDSTMRIWKKLQEGDEGLISGWISSKVVTNEFEYAILLSVLSLYQVRNSSEVADSFDATNQIVLNRIVENGRNALPSFSNLISWDKLDDIIRVLIQTTFKDTNSFESFRDRFNVLVKSAKSNFGTIIMYLIGFNKFKESKAELKNISESFKSVIDTYYAQFKFPDATRSNASEVNQLMDLVIYIASDRSLSAYLNIHSSINKYIHVTYHNVKVMKLWCLEALINGSNLEAKSTFRTYINYIKDYKAKHNGGLYDIMDVIHTFLFTLEKISENLRDHEEYRELNSWAKEARHIIDALFTIIGTDKTTYHRSLRKKLAEIYYICAVIKENSLKLESEPASKIGIISEYLTRSVSYLSNDLKLLPIYVASIYYKHSYYLHKLGLHKKAIKYCKESMRHHPDKIKYINYYVKLLTGDEDNLEKALLISQQVIENLHAVADSKRSMSWKNDALESYLIFLTLLGDSAIEVLGPFFGFINKIFENQEFREPKGTSKNSGEEKVLKNTTPAYSVVNGNSEDMDGCTSCALSVDSMNKGSTFKSVLKIGSGKGNKKDLSVKAIRRSLHVHRKNSLSTSSCSPGSQHHPERGKTTNAMHKEEEILLCHMWLVLSRLFQANGYEVEALQCVEEAEDLANTPIMEIGVYARKGCVLATRETQEEVNQGCKYLEKSFTMLEEVSIENSLHMLNNEPRYTEWSCILESIVGVAQVARDLERAGDRNATIDVGVDRESSRARAAHAQKMARWCLQQVAQHDNATLRLLFCDNDNVVAAQDTVHGWHGLGIYCM